MSPLAESNNIYKTYLNYQVSCHQTAELLKGRGVERVGVLKLNLELGDLCTKGIQEVYGDNAVVETYNQGTTDFRSLLTKLNNAHVQAIFHGSFQPETLASLKSMSDLGMRQTFVGLSETITPDIIPQYGSMLEGSIMFGLPSVSPDIISRMKNEIPNAKIIDENAAALAYVHIMQLAHAFNTCGNQDLACVRAQLDASAPNPQIGFQGFKNRIGGFDTLIKEWKNGGFVVVTK